MGVSLGFFRDHQEVFCADGHGDLLNLIDGDIGGPVDDVYDDFWVTLDTIGALENTLTRLASDSDIILSDRGPGDIAHIASTSDQEFAWEDLLRCYASLAAAMRCDVETNGPLICGWSA